MPVSGVVIRCRPERSNELARELHLPGAVEINHVLDDGTLVAVIESASVATEVELVKELMAADGVLDVSIAYHNFEDLDEQAY
jgi:nitrate reductase NapD